MSQKWTTVYEWYENKKRLYYVRLISSKIEMSEYGFPHGIALSNTFKNKEDAISFSKKVDAFMNATKNSFNDSILYETSLPYLPKNNKATYRFVNDTIDKNVTASFVIAFYGDKLVLANNIKRGMEIPGGHIEKGETSLDAAIQELKEETGCILDTIKPFIRLEMICEGEKPDNYKYPFPKSYMEFFIGNVSEIGHSIFENEVYQPYFIDINEGSDEFFKKMETKSFEKIINAAIEFKNKGKI